MYVYNRHRPTAEEGAMTGGVRSLVMLCVAAMLGCGSGNGGNQDASDVSDARS
jgi:hypothetical protein